MVGKRSSESPEPPDPKHVKSFCVAAREKKKPKSSEMQSESEHLPVSLNAFLCMRDRRQEIVSVFLCGLTFNFFLVRARNHQESKNVRMLTEIEFMSQKGLTADAQSMPAPATLHVVETIVKIASQQTFGWI